MALVIFADLSLFRQIFLRINHIRYTSGDGSHQIPWLNLVEEYASDRYISVVCACQILRRFDLSHMTHPSSQVRGNVSIEKMAIIIITFGPVLINGRCIGYMLANDS